MDIKVLGIDLGKNVCSLAGLDETGAVVFRKRLQRHRLLDFLDTLPPCVVAMEACGGAHHIGRFCLEKGHEPRLMSPLYVRPYVKVHKNDDRDAEAIAEAATRPTRHCCTTLRRKDSPRESGRLRGWCEQARPCPLPHDELEVLQRSPETAWIAADLA
ncbi:transposase [Hoeflea sp. CAU 1731]